MNFVRICIRNLMKLFVLRSHGRTFRLKHAEEHRKKHQTKECKPRQAITWTILLVRTSEGFEEAFRPTTPGHCPGVGHSIHN